MTNTHIARPKNPFPILPLRHGVLFPGTTVTLPVGRPQSMELLRSLDVPGALIGIAVQRDSAVVDPSLEELHPIGTLARVQELVRTRDGLRVTVEGLARFRIERLRQNQPFWLGDGGPVEELSLAAEEAKALGARLLEAVGTIMGGGKRLDALVAQLSQIEDGGLLADRVAAILGLETPQEVQVLLSLDHRERIELVTRYAEETSAAADVRTKIEDSVRRELNKTQREVLLREQLKAIKKELGDDEGEERDALRQRLADAKLPDEVRAVVDRELKRLEGLSSSSPEQGVIRTYLEWIADLPWTQRAEASIDIEQVSRRLDADHFGLEDVKKRILEHLAVLKVSGNSRGTILCLSGPPGVGKTSLGQSIAAASGRPFVRVSFGGVRDEAEVRGHRRTYVGALPGRIIHALKKAKVKNPVFLLDEIDKLGHGWAGDPEAALLEVLDPEQNKTFQDHYLELPFDLSEVLFICTANTLETLSPPLRDRLEVIEISGYTPDEKAHIARDHLIPKKLAEHGLGPEQLGISDAALSAMISGYTREPGVRQLAREITKLCRAVVLEAARTPDAKPAPVQVGEGELRKYLGKARFWNEAAERTQQSGVATGLAWTPVGGDILFIETSRMPGKGQLEITGQLGDVMKESARAALTYVRSNADTLGVDPRFLDGHDVHVHVPAGGVPKDGPSAGVTIFTALTSLLTGRRVRPDTAMTGECTLRGRVLPVGGIKDKVLAAHRAGLTRVILPKHNQRDIDDIPAEARQKLEIILAEDMGQVLEAALEPALPSFMPATAAPANSTLNQAA
jgi:ATP-dependent Lon protease